MKIDKLEIGKTYKNYKELCEVLNISIKSGKSKVAQLKELERHIRYHKDKHKFIIDEVYPVPLPPRKNCSMKPISELGKDILKSIVHTYGEDTSRVGISSHKTFTWKCEYCERYFNESVANVLRYDVARCINCKISKGARCIKELLDLDTINYEMEVSFDGLIGVNGGLLKFDYVLYDYSNNILGIIEYDGEYHDTSETTMAHDELKNEFCKVKNIPLLRLHHSESFHELKAINFLESIGHEILLDRMKEYRISLIDQVKEKRSKLESEIEELNKLLK